VARGRRAAPDRRAGTGRAGGTTDTDEDDEEADTSVSDLTTEADPATFDQTFTDADADLRIEGEFEPVAGPKQVIPRVAYVLNYNLVYNEARDRWEPQKKVSNTGGGGLSEYELVDTVDETISSGSVDRVTISGFDQSVPYITTAKVDAASTSVDLIILESSQAPNAQQIYYAVESQSTGGADVIVDTGSGVNNVDYEIEVYQPL